MFYVLYYKHTIKYAKGYKSPSTRYTRSGQAPFDKLSVNTKTLPAAGRQAPFRTVFATIKRVQEVKHKNFHIIDDLASHEKKAFILEEWKPEQDIYIIGAQLGLLCYKNDHSEIYIAVSKNPEINNEKYFLSFKRDYLFYAQRDVYAYSTAPNDLTSEIFLPSGHGFFIKKGEPIYIKAGALNSTDKDIKYDVFCNLYYTEA